MRSRTHPCRFPLVVLALATAALGGAPAAKPDDAALPAPVPLPVTIPDPLGGSPTQDQTPPASLPATSQAAPAVARTFLRPSWREVGVGTVRAVAAPGAFGVQDVDLAAAEFGARRK
jgi:hypothetical protein